MVEQLAVKELYNVCEGSLQVRELKIILNFNS